MKNNLAILLLSLILNIGSAEYAINTFNIGCIGLAVVVSIVLNLIIPHSKTENL